LKNPFGNGILVGTIAVVKGFVAITSDLEDGFEFGAVLLVVDERPVFSASSR